MISARLPPRLFFVTITSSTNIVSSRIPPIDGKEARRTRDAKNRPHHVVSAFSHEYGLVMGQIACEEKSNEITAVPELLEMLEIRGCIVTIDAMGTQMESALFDCLFQKNKFF